MPSSQVWLAVPQSAAPTAIAASSPSPLCRDHGSPATWYSSVSRGSKVRRRVTLLVLPPVATRTPLRALTFTVRPSRVAVTPSTRPAAGLSRTMLVILWRRRTCAPLARALFSSARTRPDPTRVGWCVTRSLATGHWTVRCCRRTREAWVGPTRWSWNWTPFAIRNSKVGAFSSAKARTRSRSL